MSRDPLPGTEDPDSGPPPGPQGRLSPTGPGALVATALAGLVVGWALRPVAVALGTTAPRVTWLQAGALYFVAAVLAVTARATHQALHHQRGRLQAHQAVNRLVLAKSCAVAGALILGGYLGYALSFVGVDSELADERIARSLVAAGGAALTMVASLVLERACQVRDDDDEP